MTALKLDSSTPTRALQHSVTSFISDFEQVHEIF
jgi:hypothetical protein